ncbi:MAG: serine/threonine protein kinase [Bacteroidia bacterium]|nr:serine/threonine protein kinase [Bacteroidia bacterium]MCX7651703.1 serine/threonine protein kinase [Bacteroidia bacterium]MDW8417435.1 serine/threonine-protein kinase [Bacteroidia bacterium]
MQVGNYVLQQVLGEGGMGRVWLAQHIHLGTSAVVKSLHPQYAQNEQLHQRFLAEARLLAQLRHPAVVRLYDFTIQEGIPYLIMEYVQGESLESYIQSRGTLSLPEIITILSPIFDALRYLHAQRVIHRDVKPSNILVRPDGTGKLIDFGIAKALDEDFKLTRTGTQIGTALYMAPEQIKGEAVSPQTDLYAIGLVIYECFFGRFPWEWQGLTAFQIYQRLLTEPPPIPQTTPPAVQAFFNKALAKEVANRFSSAEEMHQALVALNQRDGVKNSAAVVHSSSVSSDTQDSPALQKDFTPTPSLSSASVEASIPSTAKPTRSPVFSLLILGGVLLVAVLAFFLFRLLNFSEDADISPRDRIKIASEDDELRTSKPVDIGDKVRNDLREYLRSYEPSETVEILWGSIPTSPIYDYTGTLSVPVTVNYIMIREDVVESSEDCYISGIPIGPPLGTQRVWTHYRVRYLCTTSDYAKVSYDYNPVSDHTSFSIQLPPRPEDNCQEVDRERIREERGDCE